MKSGTDNMDYQEKVRSLQKEQKKDWPLLGINLDGLKHARVREFSFDDFTIRVQFNPKRITSSAAKVDPESINKRRCFLCAVNRPEEQNEILFENDYEILCNPFPIFIEHYSIVKLQHVPQTIKGNFGRLLDLSKALPELVVFYNGPRCGASAPDHMHFQAGNLDFLPIETEYKNLMANHRSILNSPEISITAIDDGLRRFFILESTDKESTVAAFEDIIRYADVPKVGEEPMMNILAYYSGKWRVMVFLRNLHRPWQFFKKGEENILISPAAVDFGGTLITPLEKDFLKITREEIIDIFHQVSYSPEKFGELADQLFTRYSK